MRNVLCALTVLGLSFAASAAAALLFGVPTIAAIAAGALVGTLALGRERSPSRETPMG